MEVIQNGLVMWRLIVTPITNTNSTNGPLFSCTCRNQICCSDAHFLLLPLIFVRNTWYNRIRNQRPRRSSVSAEHDGCRSFSSPQVVLIFLSTNEWVRSKTTSSSSASPFSVSCAASPSPLSFGSELIPFRMIIHAISRFMEVRVEECLIIKDHSHYAILF